MCVIIIYMLLICCRNREARLRHHLGTRYDSRSGVFDWDYHMKLHEMVSYIIIAL